MPYSLKIIYGDLTCSESLGCWVLELRRSDDRVETVKKWVERAKTLPAFIEEG